MEENDMNVVGFQPDDIQGADSLSSAAPEPSSDKKPFSQLLGIPPEVINDIPDVQERLAKICTDGQNRILDACRRQKEEMRKVSADGGIFHTVKLLKREYRENYKAEDNITQAAIWWQARHLRHELKNLFGQRTLAYTNSKGVTSETPLWFICWGKTIGSTVSLAEFAGLRPLVGMPVEDPSPQKTLDRIRVRLGKLPKAHHAAETAIDDPNPAVVASHDPETISLAQTTRSDWAERYKNEQPGNSQNTLSGNFER